MSVQHADPRKGVVHLHEERASVTKRRIVTGRPRFGVSHTNDRERVMLPGLEVMATRDSFECPVADGRPKESVTQSKPN